MAAAQWLAAGTPLLAIVLLLIVLRLPAIRAMPLALLASASTTALIWAVPPTVIAASLVEGAIIASGILLIVAGAVGLLAVMEVGGGMSAIRAEFARFSPDSRVQAMLVGWLFVSFVESAAGFGTPAPVVAPILMALGFSAPAAVVLTLVANSSAVTFGGVGTPILVGLAAGLDLDPTRSADYAVLQNITTTELAMDIGLSLLITLTMLRLLTGRFAAHPSRRAFREAVPLAVASALLFSVPAYLVTRFAGIEFGGLVGALIGIAGLVAIGRRGLLMPRSVWTIQGGFAEPGSSQGAPDAVSDPGWPVWKTWGPYLLLIALLLITRLVPPVRAALTAVTVGADDIAGTGLSASFAPLYSPGLSFLVVMAATVGVHRVRWAALRPTLHRTGTTLRATAVVLVSSVALVQVWMNSGVNDAGLAAMPQELAAAMADGLGSAWPLAAPFLGALGSFIGGSATLANLMFAQVQLEVAGGAGLDPTVVLAQQVGGANAGSILSVSKVVAVAAVTGLLHREGAVVRQIAPMALAYAAGFAVLGWVLSRFG